MTPKELDDFIEHGEKHISHFIIVFGEEWVRHAIQIASELRHRLAHPEREWVGLTDEEQNQVAWSCGAMSADWLDFARAIESKLREKNSA